MKILNEYTKRLNFTVMIKKLMCEPRCLHLMQFLGAKLVKLPTAGDINFLISVLEKDHPPIADDPAS